MNSPHVLFSFILPSPNFWSSFNRYYFSLTYMCTHFFAPYSPSHTLSPSPPHYGCQPFPQAGVVLPVLLFSDFVEEKRENENHDILTYLG
jgi:hypothetical protein